LVEANSATYTNLIAAIDKAVAFGAKVVSNSWGSAEFSGETTYDSHFNRPGVAFTVSAGDAGYGAQYPASSQYVTAVGGTSLFLNADGSYNSELAWSGTGSGCSAYEPKPLWQIGITDSLCAKRMVADVSAVADPNTGAAVYDSYGYSGIKGWFQVGGTSLSAPLVAAVYALSGNTSGNANQIPYTLGSLATNLRDIISGSNGLCGGSYLCTALAGYDGPTGLGTPNGAAAF
jgi:subtilase family serine protease